MNLDKIREVAEHALDNTTDMGFLALNTILRLVDEAEKDTTAWAWDGWKDDEDKAHFAGYRCKKCWQKSVIKYPFCPGCGRKITKEARHD
jgi:hypothetical protein